MVQVNQNASPTASSNYTENNRQAPTENQSKIGKYLTGLQEEARETFKSLSRLVGAGLNYDIRQSAQNTTHKPDLQNIGEVLSTAVNTEQTEGASVNKTAEVKFNELIATAAVSDNLFQPFVPQSQSFLGVTSDLGEFFARLANIDPQAKGILVSGSEIPTIQNTITEKLIERIESGREPQINLIPLAFSNTAPANATPISLENRQRVTDAAINKIISNLNGPTPNLQQLREFALNLNDGVPQPIVKAAVQKSVELFLSKIGTNKFDHQSLKFLSKIDLSLLKPETSEQLTTKLVDDINEGKFGPTDFNSARLLTTWRGKNGQDSRVFQAAIKKFL